MGSFRDNPPLSVDSLRDAYGEGFDGDPCRYDENTVHEAAYWAGKMNREYGRPILAPPSGE